MKNQSIITIFMICSVLLLIQTPITFASKPIEVTFGLGWGFSGLCPGSALASVGVGNLPALIGIAGMFIGA